MASRAVGKNPVLDKEFYNTLPGLLEFFDLRQLQELITNKATWKQFEPVFAHKENLTLKFNQLAEVRNAIRHSRALDRVTEKEGEAAVLWFRHVLKATDISNRHTRS